MVAWRRRSNKLHFASSSRCTNPMAGVALSVPCLLQLLRFPIPLTYTRHTSVSRGFCQGRSIEPSLGFDTGTSRRNGAVACGQGKGTLEDTRGPLRKAA